MIVAAFKYLKVCFVEEALYLFCMSKEVELGLLSKRYREKDFRSLSGRTQRQ